MTNLIDDSDQLQAWGPPRDRQRKPPRRLAKDVSKPVAFLATALIVGVAFDTVVQVKQPGLGWSLGCVVAAVGLLVVAETRRPMIIAALAALSFVPWFALRSSAWVLLPNVVAFIALIAYAADLAAGGPVRRSVTGLCRVMLGAFGATFEAPSVIGRASSSVLDRFAGQQRGTWRRVGRSLVIAVPVLIALFFLLMSGDALFAATFDVNVDEAFAHVARTVVGLVLFSVLVVMATAPSRSRAVVRPARLRSLDAAMLLGGVSLVFAAYAVVQLSALLSGAQYVEEKTGLTYAEYARSGFFQLMAAAVISFVVLCVVRPTVHEAAIRRRVLLRSLVALVVVLTQVLVVGSIIRLRLYSDVFGLTHLRLYTVVSAVWLGLVVILAGAAALRRGRGDWMAVTASALAALAVLAMNFVNPDRLVAQENIGRVDVSEADFDGPYLASLSSDAIPWIVDHIDEVPAEQRGELVEALCATPYDAEGWLAFNAADEAAEEALSELCD